MERMGGMLPIRSFGFALGSTLCACDHCPASYKYAH
jgi:hypothetical protein